MGADIVLASINDIPQLVRMGERFFNASGYRGVVDYNKEAVANLMEQLIAADGLITDGKHGMLGFVTFPCFFDPDKLMMQELFWWVDEEARGSGLALKMLNYAETLAKMNGCVSMSMLSLADLDGERVNKLYRKSGYRNAETVFMKVLTNGDDHSGDCRRDFSE